MSRYLRLPIRAFSRWGPRPSSLLPITVRTTSLGRLAPFRRIPALSTRSFASNSSPPPSPSSSETSDIEKASITQRLKLLMKKYGWYALGVYFMIGAVDFGVSFVGINLLGAELVSHYTSAIKHAVMSRIYGPSDELSAGKSSSDQELEAGGHESLYAMIILAYTVHKTVFLPVRVGLTAALTPRFVGWLSRRGWHGSAGAKRAMTEMRDTARRKSAEMRR